MNEDRNPKRSLRRLSALGMLSTIGLTMALSIAISIGIGLLLDRWLHKPWIIMVMALLGVVAGFQQMIRTVLQANAEQDEEDAEEAARRRNGREPSTLPEDPDDLGNRVERDK